MLRSWIGHICLVALGVLALSGCTDPSGQSRDDKPARVISAQEREAAQALSVLNAKSASIETDPLVGAVRCEAALAFLEQRMKSAVTLTPAQAREFRRISGVYTARANAAAKIAQTSEEVISELRQSASLQERGEAELARTAIACIQNLSSK